MANNIKIPIFKTGQNVSGCVLTRETITSILDRFLLQKEIPVKNSSGEVIGKIINLSYKDDTLFCHVEFTTDKQYSQLKINLETFTSIHKAEVI